MPSLELRLRLETLYDTYGPLLTSKQQEVFRLHYHDDLSMGEISEQLGISRPAVADSLRRSEEFLEHCEMSLGLSGRMSQLEGQVGYVLGLLSGVRDMMAGECPKELSAAIDALRALVR